MFRGFLSYMSRIARSVIVLLKYIFNQNFPCVTTNSIKKLTFLLMVMSVKMECTLQVFENIAPNANENPAISNHARAAHMYGNMFILVIRLLRPRNMTLLYVNIAPMIIKLFKCGLDIFMYLKHATSVLQFLLLLCITL